MKDKRDECGCHRECTMLPHECTKPCEWPSCLTDTEQQQLCDDLEYDEELTVVNLVTIDESEDDW